MKLIMFAGPGNVGKTSLLEALTQLALDRNISVSEHKSNTRNSYKKAGLNKESEALKDPAFNKRFQKTVMRDNTEELLEKLSIARDLKVNLFVTDRSPFDYAAYQLYEFRDTLTLEEIQNLRDEVISSLISVSNIVADFNLVPISYPTAWSKQPESNSSDGWRHDLVGKNFIWSSVINSEIQTVDLTRLRIQAIGNLSLDSSPVKVQASRLMTYLF